MKLFEDSQGFIISFGFDMREHKPNDRMICWCDPVMKVWEATAANLAGWLVVPVSLATEFVFENREGSVVAYQPGLCVELRRQGRPLVFSTFILRAG
jgi:hypothetical protein